MRCFFSKHRDGCLQTIDPNAPAVTIIFHSWQIAIFLVSKMINIMLMLLISYGANNFENEL